MSHLTKSLPIAKSLCLALAVGLPQVSMADDRPSAYGQMIAGSYYQGYNVPLGNSSLMMSLGSADGPDYEVTFVNGGTAPSVGATVVDRNSHQLSAQTNYTYYFRVVDPTIGAGVSVPVDIGYSVSVNTNIVADWNGAADWYGEAKFSVRTIYDVVRSGNAQACDYFGTNICGQPSHSGTFHYSASNTEWIAIGLHTFSSTGSYGSGTVISQVDGGTVNVAADWLAAHPNSAATIEFSSVSAPVPEPESYALLLAGLGLVGLRARRHG